MGKFKSPTKPKKLRHIDRDFRLAMAAHILIKEFSLALSRNNISGHQDSACDFVAEAAKISKNRGITYNTVLAACKKYSGFGVGV